MTRIQAQIASWKSSNKVEKEAEKKNDGEKMHKKVLRRLSAFCIFLIPLGSNETNTVRPSHHKSYCWFFFSFRDFLHKSVTINEEKSHSKMTGRPFLDETYEKDVVQCAARKTITRSKYARQPSAMSLFNIFYFTWKMKILLPDENTKMRIRLNIPSRNLNYVAARQVKKIKRKKRKMRTGKKQRKSNVCVNQNQWNGERK